MLMQGIYGKWRVKQIQKSMKNIKNSKGKDIVLFLGPTGSGKSTTINYLLGKKFIGIPKSSKKKMEPFSSRIYSDFKFDVKAGGNDVSSPKIGHTSVSQTTYPKSYTSPILKEFALCDCPGFFDSRGDTMEYVIALSTRLVIEQANSVKAIVFVMDWSSIEAARGKLFKQTAEALENLIDNPLKCGESIFYIYSKPQSKSQKRSKY